MKRAGPLLGAPAGGSSLRRLRVAAGTTRSGHSVAVARIVFGLVAAFGAARTLWLDRVDRLWVEPALLLGWPGLDLPLLPAPALHALVAALGLLGLLIAAGAWTRRAAAAFALGFGYLELLDRTTYLNHYWAITLLAVLFVLIPHDGTWSLHRGSGGGVPSWALWLLRGQVAVIYVFAGLAKLDPDWLLRGEPLATWLAARTDLPLLGGLLGLPGAGLTASWAGALFDLTIVLWLWWRPTRLLAMGAVIAFHVGTWMLFPPIAVFPWLMIGLATLWLPPDWPLAVRARLRRMAPATARPRSSQVRGAVQGRGAPQEPAAAPGAPRVTHVSGWTLALVAAWLLVQVTLPLRHLAIPGDVRWTEEGGRFAWRVMAEEKVGWAVFHVTDPGGGRAEAVPITDVLTPAQAHVAAVRPDLLHQLAGVLAARQAAGRGGRPEVRVDAWVTWNGRPHARLIDPTVDLASRPWTAGHQPWILPPP